MTRIVLPVLCLELFLLAGAVPGQIVAKQGKPLAPKRAFHSSMVLTIPLKPIAELRPVSGFAVNDSISQYTCNGVFIKTLSVEVERSHYRHHNQIPLRLEGEVVVPRSHDRLIDLTFIVKQGEKPIGERGIHNMDAEEGKTAPFRATINFNRAELESAFTKKPVPMLEIKMVVRDNS